MRYTSFIIFTLIAQIALAQETNFGSATTLNVGTGATFYAGGSATFNGNVTNEGNAIIESDGRINGTMDNAGVLQIKGDGALEATSALVNRTGSTAVIEGNSNMDGTITNNGDFLVSGAASSVVNGSIDNNSQLRFDTDIQINGTIDNTSGTLGINGNAIVAGTLLNPDGAVTSVEGNLTLGTPFTNGGILRSAGETVISDTFSNNNEVVFGGSTTFNGATANNQRMLLAANTVFNGVLTNSGEIVSIADADINFVNNKQLGTLSFTDVVDRNPINEVILLSSADTIFIDNLNLNTAGRVSLPPNFVLVQTSMNINEGVLNATNQETFLVQGTINVNTASDGSPSYVEGQMLAITTTDATTFPMGINGAPNYVTLSSNTPGIVVKVECRVPNADSLLTDENTMGMASEVEWSIQSSADSAEVSVSVDYSGVDFTNTPNFINAREYDATLQRFGDGDSLFHALKTIDSNNDNNGAAVPVEGTIRTSDLIWITPTPTRFALGISPVLTEPEVYLPNVFAPGASINENKIFRPFIGGAVVSSVTFLVYDSFNREVYAETISGEDLSLENLGWDGNLKSGLEAPEGVYYYNISIAYTISNDVSDKYFTAGERDQTQNFSKLGSVLLVK
ncbi:hypothetical protein [Reichenbachiella sp.]|uniref:hypothetical protein n=2 Tax=Reichenbachiella sp. TaxID=2184521 RepID=UPI0032970167